MFGTKPAEMEAQETMSRVCEIAMFRLRPGVDRERLLMESDRVGNWLRQRSGFVGRELLEDETGQWVDLIRWETMEDAMSAFAEFEQDPEMNDFISLLDPDSMQMLHAKTVIAAA